MSESGQTTPDAGAETTTDTPDPVTTAIDQRFSEFGQQFKQELQTGLEGLREAFQPAEPEPEDPWAQFTQEPDYGQDTDLYANEQPDVSPDQARQILEHTIQQQVGPLQQQLQELQLRGRAEQVASKYPALRDQDTVDKLAPTVERMASQIGRPELANNPDFFALNYLAGLAQAQAQGETPPGADEVQVHGPGGAGPQGVSADDIGDRIVNSGRSPW